MSRSVAQWCGAPARPGTQVVVFGDIELATSDETDRFRHRQRRVGRWHVDRVHVGCGGSFSPAGQRGVASGLSWRISFHGPRICFSSATTRRAQRPSVCLDVHLPSSFPRDHVSQDSAHASWPVTAWIRILPQCSTEKCVWRGVLGLDRVQSFAHQSGISRLGGLETALGVHLPDRRADRVSVFSDSVYPIEPHQD